MQSNVCANLFSLQTQTGFGFAVYGRATFIKAQAALTKVMIWRGNFHGLYFFDAFA